MKMVFYAYFASFCQENGLLDLPDPVLSSGKSGECKYFRRAVSQTKNRSLKFLIHFQILLMYFHFTGTIAQNLVMQCSSNLSVVLPKESWLDLNCHLLSLLLVRCIHELGLESVYHVYSWYEQSICVYAHIEFSLPTFLKWDTSLNFNLQNLNHFRRSSRVSSVLSNN